MLIMLRCRIKSCFKYFVFRWLKFVIYSCAEQVQAPSIETMFRSREEGGCWVALKCSTEDEGVELSWGNKPPAAIIYSKNNTAETNSVILAFFETHEKQATFTCTSSRAMGKASKDITVELPGKETTRHHNI